MMGRGDSSGWDSPSGDPAQQKLSLAQTGGATSVAAYRPILRGIKANGGGPGLCHASKSTLFFSWHLKAMLIVRFGVH